MSRSLGDAIDSATSDASSGSASATVGTASSSPSPSRASALPTFFDTTPASQLGATRRWQRVEDRARRVNAVQKQRVQVRIELDGRSKSLNDRHPPAPRKAYEDRPNG